MPIKWRVYGSNNGFGDKWTLIDNRIRSHNLSTDAYATNDTTFHIHTSKEREYFSKFNITRQYYV